MEWIDKVMDYWQLLCEKAAPTVKKVSGFLYELKKAILFIWDFVKRMKKVVLAAPIAFLAVVIAIYNLASLPALVGIFLLESGDYAFQMLRELVVLSCMALTALCLLLMFISKRTMTPWLVSLFSLALPLVILLTNVFPA